MRTNIKSFDTHEHRAMWVVPYVASLVNVVAYNSGLLVPCIGVSLNIVQACKEILTLFTSHLIFLYILNLESMECNDPHTISTMDFIFQSFPTISIDGEPILHSKATHFFKTLLSFSQQCIHTPPPPPPPHMCQFHKTITSCNSIKISTYSSHSWTIAIVVRDMI